MQIEQIKELYDYDHWANERLWQAAGGLNQEELNIDMHNGIGSIQTQVATLTFSYHLNTIGIGASPVPMAFSPDSSGFGVYTFPIGERQESMSLLDPCEGTEM
jgi:hypothetical protein